MRDMVEWKKLGLIADISIGEFVHKNKQNPDAFYPVYNGGITYTGFYDKYNNTENKIVISARGATAGFVNRVFCKYWAGNSSYSVDVNPLLASWTFVYYFLKNYQSKLISDQQKGGGIPSISKKQVQDIVVPVPSLSEQTRIVGILDTFTASIENLKEQIAERCKQYEHYRDQLLDLEGKEGVTKILLKDVCDVINGRAYSQPELLNEGKYRVLRVGNFFSNDSWYYSDLELEDKYYCEKGDLLYAWSASFGPHIWEEEKVIYHYHIWKMNCGERLQKKFMYYWLQSEDMKKQAFTNLHGATMAHLTKALMESLMVPIPSFSEQRRIVTILDTFEASIANLEAQLKEREKQYEYYRNKLLTFE